MIFFRPIRLRFFLGWLLFWACFVIAAPAQNEDTSVDEPEEVSSSLEEEFYKDPAILSGVVVDPALGKRINGAIIRIENTNFIAFSDLNGDFTIRDIPEGEYTIRVECSGFQTTIIEEVVLLSGELSEVEIGLGIENASLQELEAFVVSFDDVQTGDLLLLADRQESSTLSDAIGEDSFSRFGLGDAAEAMTKVTGASIVDGKYMVIRGLGERYTNTLLNGFGVASADPDRRAVQMDQFPSDVLESIVVSKSFTPDQPGAFSGGSVNMKTKSFPDKFFFKTGVSVSMNTNVFNEPTLNIPSGSDFWKGEDGGYRDLPNDFPEEINNTLTASRARLLARQGDFTVAEELDAFSNSFQNEGFYPVEDEGGFDYGTNFSVGDQIIFNEKQSLGYILSGNYNRSESHFTDGITGRYSQGSVDITAPNFVDLTRLFTPNTEEYNFSQFIEAGAEPPGGLPEFGVTRTIYSVNWSIFGQLAFKFNPQHQITGRFFHNQSAEDSVKRGVGEAVRSDSGGEFRESHDQLFTERGISSAQLEGQSQFSFDGNDLGMKWRLGYSKSTQDQPDFRSLEFKYSFVLEDYDPSGTFNNRFSRSLEEDNTEFGIDFDLDINQLSGPEGNFVFKFGGMISDGSRVNRERQFQTNFGNVTTLDRILAVPNPVGITERTDDSVTFGTWMRETSASLNYDGTQEIWAAYGMVDWKINSRWRVVGGMRLEHTFLETDPIQIDNPDFTGSIDQDDSLPALSVVFSPTEKMNFRLAYGKTIARPTYREQAGVNLFEPFTEEFISGNPQIKISEINNYDFRWEWYPKAGDLFAVSLFYKELTNPIEVAFSQGFNAPQNLESGTVFGVEFEARAYLDYIHEALKNVSVSTNFSWTESEVDIPESELTLIRQFDPDAEDTRELFGQSPYLFNFDISYEMPFWDANTALSYNIFGERLALVTTGVLPDVFEQPRETLNFFFSKKFGDAWTVKFSAKNLLDPDYEESFGANGKTFIYEGRTSGRSFGFSFSYEI